ncbi:MAG: TOMM precursor leader peptide-binding protein [Jatrophihabitantaceae bacterium]
MFPPMPINDRLIAIGGVDYGTAAELSDDEDGHLWQLLGLLDGTRTRTEVAAELQRVDPTVPTEDVNAVIDMLAQEGYLEDADAPIPDILSAIELERYRRNSELFAFFARHPETGLDLQARLKRSRVTVIGVGGLGSYLALALGATGVGNLHLIDDDVVEEHNLNRQILYTAADVGRSKVVAARERIAALNPYITVTATEARINGVDDARSCFANRDLVVCAADRPRITIYDWLNEASVAEQVAWIRGANDGLTVNTIMHVPGVTACFECEQRNAHARFEWYAARIKFARETIGDRTVNPCTAPIAGMIGSMTALECVKYLTGATTPAIQGRKLTFDLQTLETRFHDGVRDPDCPVCGPKVLTSMGNRSDRAEP